MEKTNLYASGESFAASAKKWVGNDPNCKWHPGLNLPWISFCIYPGRFAIVHPYNPTQEELDNLLLAITYRAISHGYSITISPSPTPAMFFAQILEDGEVIAQGQSSSHSGASALDAWCELLTKIT